jgi:cytochrome b561
LLKGHPDFMNGKYKLDVEAHIGAALYHHFVRKDRVLMRMITG